MKEIHEQKSEGARLFWSRVLSKVDDNVVKIYLLVIDTPRGRGTPAFTTYKQVTIRHN